MSEVKTGEEVEAEVCTLSQVPPATRQWRNIVSCPTPELSRTKPILISVNPQWLQLKKPNGEAHVRVAETLLEDDLADLPAACCLMATSNAWDLLFIGGRKSKSAKTAFIFWRHGLKMPIRC